MIFVCILIASDHSFADNNSLSSFATTVEDLQFECNVAIEWFIEKKKNVNPNKFQAILLDKEKSDYTGTKLSVVCDDFQVVSSVDVLDIAIDDRFNLNLHFDRI